MTTLPTVRTRVRKDLQDIDPDRERWNDDQLDRHIRHALSELSLSIPREASALLALTPGSRTVSTATLAGLIRVEAVEHPIDEYPAIYTSFSHWEHDLLLHLATPPDGGQVRIWYVATHQLDDEGSTLPAALEDVLATGAGAFAALEWAAATIDQLTTGDRVAERYAAWGRAAHTAFVQMLLEHGRRRRLRQRQLSVPA